MAQRKRPPTRGPGTKGRPTPSRAASTAARGRTPAKSSARGTAAGSGPTPFLTPGGTPFRHSVERRSAVALVFLHRLPRAVPGLIVLALAGAGLVAPPAVSGIALMLVAALLIWLVYLSWPTVPAVGRAVRLVVIAIVVAYAASRFVV